MQILKVLILIISHIKKTGNISQLQYLLILKILSILYKFLDFFKYIRIDYRNRSIVPLLINIDDNIVNAVARYNTSLLLDNFTILLHFINYRSLNRFLNCNSC